MSGERDSLVTVGLPVYNGEEFLREAIESVLGQTHRHLELVISDNASTDGTPAICAEYAGRDTRVRLITQERNIGAAPNFNLVLDEAQGEFFKWMAHDDVCRPRFIEACLQALSEDPAAVMAYPTPIEIDALGAEVGSRDSGLEFDTPDPVERFQATMSKAHKNWILFGLMHTDVARRTGKHGTYPAADRVFVSELTLHGKIVEVLEPLYLHREHDQRYVHTFDTVESKMEWHDPSRAARLNLPTWLRLRGYLGAIWRSPLRIQQKASAVLWMVRWAIDLRRDLLTDLGYGLEFLVKRVIKR